MEEKIGPATADEITPDPAVLEAMDAGDDAPITALTTRPVYGVDTLREPAFTEQINLPWLAVAHGVGGLSRAGFSPGDLVLGKEYCVYSPARPMAKPPTPETAKLAIIVLTHRLYWKQYMSQAEHAAKITPQVFTNLRDAHKAGFTTAWDPVTQKPPTAPPAMTWQMLIEKPSDLNCEMFCIEVNGKLYAPAYMSLDKGAYLSVKDQFGLAVNYTCIKRGIDCAKWELATRVRTAKTGNETWVPYIRGQGYLTEDEVANIRAIFGVKKADPPTETVG